MSKATPNDGGDWRKLKLLLLLLSARAEQRSGARRRVASVATFILTWRWPSDDHVLEEGNVERPRWRSTCSVWVVLNWLASARTDFHFLSALKRQIYLAPCLINQLDGFPTLCCSLVRFV